MSARVLDAAVEPPSRKVVISDWWQGSPQNHELARTSPRPISLVIPPVLPYLEETTFLEGGSSAICPFRGTFGSVNDQRRFGVTKQVYPRRGYSLLNGNKGTHREWPGGLLQLRPRVTTLVRINQGFRRSAVPFRSGVSRFVPFRPVPKSMRFRPFRSVPAERNGTGNGLVPPERNGRSVPFQGLRSAPFRSIPFQNLWDYLRSVHVPFRTERNGGTAVRSKTETLV